MTDLLRIGELAGHCGVSRRTIDYYTTLGLIEPADRSGGNFRLYDPAAIDQVLLIQRLERNGVSLDDIVAALHRPVPNRTALIELLSTALDRLRQAPSTDDATDRLVSCALERSHALINLAVDVVMALTP